MTDQDNLRDRIAHLLHGHFELTAIGPIDCGHEHWSDEEHVAQAIIDEFGLTVEKGHSWAVGLRDSNGVLIKDTMAQRVVGKWERQ